MKYLITMLLLVAMTVPAFAQGYLSDKSQSARELYKMELKLMKNRPISVASLAEATADLALGKTAVLINGRPVHKAAATLTLTTANNVVGSATLVTRGAIVVCVNASGTISYAMATKGTGTTKALADAAIVYPAIPADTVPIGILYIDIAAKAAGALTWVGGTSTTATSEIMVFDAPYFLDGVPTIR